MTAKRALKSLERERDQVMLNYHEGKKAIEHEEDLLLEKIEKNYPLRDKLIIYLKLIGI
ncbi:hypothetical protein ACWAU3_08290 [Shewanella sp. JL219SE-S6]